MKLISTLILPLFLLLLLLLLPANVNSHSNNNNKDGNHNNNNRILSETTIVPNELPLVVFPNISSSSSLRSKYIPSLIWLPIKDSSLPLSKDVKDFFIRNGDWEAHACDIQCQEAFINSTYAGTSTQWAYNLIHPFNKAARTDIWKYAVLYTFGGLYIDDYVDFETPLSKILEPDDRFVVAEDPSPLSSIDVVECYIPSFHLSTTSMLSKYNPTPTLPLNESKLATWAIFVEPRNPIVLKTMTSIIEIVKSEYSRETVIAMGGAGWGDDMRQKAALCTTNYVFSHSLREAMLSKSFPQSEPRICKDKFLQYGARIRVSTSPHHPRKAHHNSHLLKEHIPLTKERSADYLEGKVINGEGKSIFLVSKGTRRAFPDFDTFLKMKYQSNQVVRVGMQVLNGIPIGDPLPSLMGSDATSGGGDASADGGVSLIDAQNPPFTNPDMVLNFTQNTINNMTFSCYGDDYSGTRDELLSGMWRKVVGEKPIMVYPLCLRLFQLGNTLGYYFNDVSCSSIVGAHFIGVHKTFSLIEPEALSTSPHNHYAFFNALPDRIIHKSPNDIGKVKELLKKECHCLQYCWENNEAPWLKRVDLIREILVGATDAYLRVANIENGTVTNNKTDLTYIPSSSSTSILPLIPNVAIQYRCGDNIGFGKTRYGLLPFRAFKSRIPQWVTSIYVIADSPNRQQGHPYSSRCGTILTALFSYLTKFFPKAIIVVKRGGDQFLDYARLIHANVTICSASTFCLWPSLANVGGNSYFPLTPLVAKATSNTTAPSLGKHFHWIDEVDMIKEFKSFRPWTQVIEVLEKE